MLKYEEGKLEANEYGARFPQRPYYPLLAANGTDAILLGLGGFPDDPNWMCYSSQLPFRINLGWYKTARKDYSYSHRRYGPSCYGTSICLAGLTTILTVGKERNLAIRNPRQYFDPKKRILTTSFGLRESRGKKAAEIKVTSFITDEHLLVERYEVLAEPENGIRFGFILDTPHSPDLYELCVHPEKIGHEKMERGFCFRYKYSSPEIYDGIAATWTDHPGSEYNGEIDYSPVIAKGKAVTHYVAVVDSYDAEDYSTEIKRLLRKTVDAGYDSILEEHIKSGKKYFSASSVTLPEKDLEYLYDYSNYILKATFDSGSGFMPMGILPGNWHNGMFWDCWFASMAWLGSNRDEESKKISCFYKNKLKDAQEVAKKLQCGGARYAWTSNRAHFELNPENVIQFHNNAVIALQCLQVYKFTGDKEFLSEIFDLLEQSLIFLTERLVRIENGQACLAECAGLDESTSDKKGTDTWTSATYSKALESYLEACAKLQRKPFKSNLSEILSMVKEAMARNIDEDGILQSFAGGMQPHWGSLIFHLYPEHPALSKTIEILSHYDMELDSYNSHEVACYKGRIFTWTEFWIAAILGMTGKPEGWMRLRKCAKFTDCFGSFPERVFYDGELLKQPFMTSHASYVWAVNSLLVSRNGDRLTICANLPERWLDLSFENLTTPDGLRVSAKMKGGIITELEIVNMNVEKRDILLMLPGEDKKKFFLKSKERFEIRH
ncbi:MAG TPA: hypothetical protein DET40_05370 [Lentisphaeria bacterium]|nr:MAG: hypothetical protein A2X45_21965 [Lentisphaerae bacterium GWF2_50_93]HCE42957.1 hypothetical protein [Lentisphaeria bacterium]